MKRLIPLFVLLAAPSLRADDLASQVTIYRDTYGVPHVFAKTDAGAVFGFMYARAEDEFLRIERHLILAIGRASAAYGEGGVAWDTRVHSYRVTERARAEYEREKPAIRALADAGARALNFFLKNNPKVKPVLLTRFEPWYFFAAQLSWHLYRAGQAARTLAPSKDGSNMWAVAPSKSASGNAMLFLNPHIPLNELYEGHVRSEDGWNFSGGTAYGMGLFPMFGNGATCGYSLTVNYPDVADVYELTFDDPKDPLAYRYGDGYRKATKWFVTIEVKGKGERKLELFRSHHGPILGKSNGKRAAVRVASIERGGMLAQWHAMTRAKNVDELAAAIVPSPHGRS